MAERQPSKLAVVGSSPIARFFPLRKSTDTKTGTTKPREPKISFGSISMPLEILQDKQRLNSLKEMLHEYSVPAAEALIEHKDGGAVQCFACGHRCIVKPGRDGVCRVRFNVDGTLLVPHGYVGVLACDPIEKKPFFHVLPGSDALTFGMLGCDYHCGYCQNWVTSQMLRDPDAIAPPKITEPEDLVEIALQHRAPVVA